MVAGLREERIDESGKKTSAGLREERIDESGKKTSPATVVEY